MIETYTTGMIYWTFHNDIVLVCVRTIARFKKRAYCDWPWIELQILIRWLGSTEARRSDHRSAKIGNQIAYCWFNVITITGGVLELKLRNGGYLVNAKLKTSFNEVTMEGVAMSFMYFATRPINQNHAHSLVAVAAKRGLVSTFLWVCQLSNFVEHMQKCIYKTDILRFKSSQSRTAFYPWRITWTIGDSKYCHDRVTSR